MFRAELLVADNVEFVVARSNLRMSSSAQAPRTTRIGPAPRRLPYRSVADFA